MECRVCFPYDTNAPDVSPYSTTRRNLPNSHHHLLLIRFPFYSQNLKYPRIRILQTHTSRSQYLSSVVPRAAEAEICSMKHGARFLQVQQF